MYLDSHLKLIIEDTAIENTCWAKCEREWCQNISDAKIESLEYLYSVIEDIENMECYKIMIETLVEYCIKIIETDWEDYNIYDNHIKYINNFQQMYTVSEPYKIILNNNNKPFGNKLPLEIQELIIKIKYNQQLKLWERYRFLIKHTNPLLDYLQQKYNSANRMINIKEFICS